MSPQFLSKWGFTFLWRVWFWEFQRQWSTIYYYTIFVCVHKFIIFMSIVFKCFQLDLQTLWYNRWMALEWSGLQAASKDSIILLWKARITIKLKYSSLIFSERASIVSSALKFYRTVFVNGFWTSVNFRAKNCFEMSSPQSWNYYIECSRCWRLFSPSLSDIELNNMPKKYINLLHCFTKYLNFCNVSPFPSFPNHTVTLMYTKLISKYNGVKCC